jgi:hypothetical protein
MTELYVLKALARAVVEIDKVAWGRRTESDEADIAEARRLLLAVIGRNGYAFAEMGQARLRKRASAPRTAE